MQRQTRNWLFFTIGAYILMFLLVPPQKGPRLSRFGFYLGLIQAIVLNWLAVVTYKLWKLPGDIQIKGLPILTCLAWIPPSILFAYYFPYDKKPIWKAAYILTYSLGTTLVQYTHGVMGMWESKKWKTIYTLPLSIATHTIMALFLPFFKLRGIREN